jgi:hypothetical protein
VCPKASEKNGNTVKNRVGGRPSLIDDSLLQQLHSQGYSDTEIANQIGCGRTAVVKARKRLRLDSNHEKVDERLLIVLNTMGMDDGSIATEMGCTRRTVTAARKRLNLSANRKRGERGLGWWNGTYYEAVLEAMKVPFIARHIFQAARHYYNFNNDEHTAWAATIVEPLALRHPEPGIAGQADKIYPFLVKKIGKYEAVAARAGVVGVPGPAILEMYRQKDTVRIEQRDMFMWHLAQKSVEEAGYINENVTVELVVQGGVKPIPAAVWFSLWASFSEMAVAWAPAADPGPKTSIPDSWKKAERLTRDTGNKGTGKRGKGGAINSLEKAAAISGINRS